MPAPSSRELACPVATKADAEFSITTFLNVLFLPLNSSFISFAFSSGSPPIISVNLAEGISMSDGLIENSLINPFFNSAQYVFPVIVTSSNPSLPWTIHAWVDPSVFKDSANGKINDLSYTPIIVFLLKQD